MQVRLTKVGCLFPRLDFLTTKSLKEVRNTIGDRAVLYCYELEEEHGLVLHQQDFDDVPNGTYDLPLTPGMFMEAANINAGGY